MRKIGKQSFPIFGIHTKNFLYIAKNIYKLMFFLDNGIFLILYFPFIFSSSLYLDHTKAKNFHFFEL